MFQDAGFPIVAVPFMLVMMLGMGLMGFMMKMKMGMGGHETQRPTAPAECNSSDELKSLRSEIASLRRELDQINGDRARRRRRDRHRLAGRSQEQSSLFLTITPDSLFKVDTMWN